MRIVFVLGIFPALSETFILNQITGLIDRGHEVDIYADNPSPTLEVQPDVVKYKLLERTCYRLQMPKNRFLRFLKGVVLLCRNLHKSPVVLFRSLNVFRYGKLAASLTLLYSVIPLLSRQGSYDIIQCHFGPVGTLGAYFREIGLIRGKLVTMFHGNDIRLGQEKGGQIYADLFSVGDSFLSNSRYNYDNLIDLGADAGKVICHQVGLDISRFPERKLNFSLRPQTIRILTVARLVKEKGLEYGIEAIGELLRKNPAIQLQYNIIGGGDKEEFLKELIRELNLTKIVHLLGPKDQKEVIGNLQQAHIFLLPSIAEAFGLVLLEAQASGLPVIATSVGGVNEALIDGQSGFLVPARNVIALVEKLEYLINNYEIWPEMGLKGRAFVKEHYDINKLNDRLVIIYRKLMNNEL
ncbi:MAG: glycosyltransferase [Sedimentisphaerales bacterium]|jgi:colanic acid/amylovoran biosynthesis glycosyltransferase